MNVYKQVAAELEKWCNDNYYTDFVVELELNGEKALTFASFDYTTFDFDFDYDWYEGEESVCLIGFTPIEEVKTTHCLRRIIKGGDNNSGTT